jgi:stalled ribosome rescue protein Dom34
MSALLIWMTKQEAKLFYVEAESINYEKFQFSGPQHPTETLGVNHSKTESDEERFFHQLAQKLKTVKARTWLLMGPSLGATHFKHFLEKHHSELSAKVIGVEKVDKMPDSEILSVGRKFLQHHYLYHPA